MIRDRHGEVGQAFLPSEYHAWGFSNIFAQVSRYNSPCPRLLPPSFPLPSLSTYLMTSQDLSLTSVDTHIHVCIHDDCIHSWSPDPSFYPTALRDGRRTGQRPLFRNIELIISRIGAAECEPWGAEWCLQSRRYPHPPEPSRPHPPKEYLQPPNKKSGTF